MSLDSFQRRVLEEFFERQSRFFLTGGGALAGLARSVSIRLRRFSPTSSAPCFLEPSSETW